jgi:hypothetical protein
MATKVTTQKELDAAIKAGDEYIIIDSPRGVWLELTSTGEAWVEARGSASVRAYGSASVRAYGSASVRAYDSASVSAYGSASVSAYGSASVSAYGSASVSAYGSASVRAYDSASVRAYGSASVSAYGSASVRAYGSASVSAYGSASVSAYGSASVSAYDSASVSAYDSASVRASGSASVRAYGSASVSASGSASVRAYGSASVSAYDSASVRAYDSASVRAYDSASVRASRFVAVHLHSASAHIKGGTVIDVTQIDLESQEHWTEYHGIETTDDGDLIVYKAVGDNLKSSYGFEYPIGETVTAPDWNPIAVCGYGLHFSPSPAQAQDYHSEATRFLKCAVAPADAVILDGSATWTTPKLKARAAKVLAEVDVHGNEIPAAESEAVA